MKDKKRQLIKNDEAAKMLDISPAVLVQWRCAERGPRYIKLSGRYIRYRPEDVKEFIDAGIIETREST